MHPEEFHTPNVKTIAEVSAFTGLPETSQMKSLVMVGKDAPVLVMLRGDHQLSETKLAAVLKAIEVRPAQPGEILRLVRRESRFAWPRRREAKMRVLADRTLDGRRNMIAGANKDDYHLKNVTPGEDFATRIF